MSANIDYQVPGGYGSDYGYTDPTRPATDAGATDWSGIGNNLMKAAGPLVQYVIDAKTGKKVVAQQGAGIQQGINDIKNIYDRTSGETSPYIQSGLDASGRMVNNTLPYTAGGQQAITDLQRMQNAPLDVAKFMDPSADYTMAQARRTLEGSAAARGGALSGAAVKDLNSMASQMSQQYYDKAVQNALASRQQQIGVGTQLYTGGLNANAQLAPTVDAGTRALGYQVDNSGRTGENIASLDVAQGNAAAAGSAPGGAKKKGFLGSILPIAGTIIGGMYGMPQVGAAVGSALGGAISSDEHSKQNIKNLTQEELHQALDGLHAKSYEYTEQNQQEMGSPAGKQVGVIAQDVQKTPAAGMVNEGSGPLTLDVKKATSFSLAALAQLNKRMNSLESRK